MAFAEVNGARLAWQQLGAGPDLILVHGLASNRAFWWPIALQLSDAFRVTLFDLRGHGYSSRPADGYRPQDFGTDILGLMDVLELPQAAVIGHSYGGAAALEAAGQAPQRITRLGVLDARIARLQPLMRLHDTPHITEVEKEIAATRPEDWASLPQVGYLFLEAAARMCLSGQWVQARDDFAPFGEGRGAARAARAWLELLDQTSARAELDVPGMPAEAIAGLRMPTLLMYGARSRCVASGQALAGLMPGAQHRLLADAGHFFPASRPELVTAAIRAFLGGQALVE